MDNNVEVAAQIRSLSMLVVLGAFAAGCASATGLAEVAGHYELRTVDGRSLPDDRLGGAISGELQLRLDGGVRRVVRYATSGVPGPIVARADGRFRVRGSDITLDLDEELRPSGTRRWRVHGVVGAGTVTLRYPGAAGGTIEEVYLRRP